MIEVYQVTYPSNSKSVGYELTLALFEKEEDAVACAEDQVENGSDRISVYRTPVFDTSIHKNAVNSIARAEALKEHIWGYRKDDSTGVFGYGYIDNRDSKNRDPEYQEYLRLKAKFGG